MISGSVAEVRNVKRFVEWLLRPAGLQVSRRDRTIVIPKPEATFPLFGCPGVDWNESAVEAFLAGPLQAFSTEYKAFPRDSPNGGYYSDNPNFGLVDAAVCYAFVRFRRPSLVVEIGSGFSTRILRSAIDKNGGGRLVSIDPAPRVSIKGLCDEHHPVRVQTMPVDWFRRLSPDAVLFIDSSHVASTGSDVVYLLLEVLPAAPQGLLIHIHDIFLPEDYPRSWNCDRGFNFSEQYLLHALLCYSNGFRVLWPGRWVARNRPDWLNTIVRDGKDLERHCSFWLERGSNA